MTDQKHGTFKVLQQVFQQLQRVDIQIVGRLVEHQYIGWPGKQPRQQQAVSLAPTETAHR